MSRITRFVVLATALTSLFAMASATAGAVTWEANGDQSFTATAGPQTLSAGGGAFVCLAHDASGVVVNRDFTVSATPSNWSFARMTVAGTACGFAGSPYSSECTYALTATTLDPAAGTVTAATGRADVTCGWYISGVEFCHLEGVTSFTYDNPSGAVGGRVTLPTDSALRTTGPSCPFGVGAVMHATPLALAITSNLGSRGPVLART